MWGGVDQRDEEGVGGGRGGVDRLRAFRNGGGFVACSDSSEVVFENSTFCL